MNITFDKRIKDDKFKEDFTAIAGIYARLLGIPDSLKLVVRLSRLNNAYAQVDQFEEYFLIKMDHRPLRKGKINMSRILAHELTHIQQFVSGKLKDDVDKGITYYNGVAYDMNYPLTYSRKKCFFILPFEREAILNERILYSALKKELKPIRLRIS